MDVLVDKGSMDGSMAVWIGERDQERRKINMMEDAQSACYVSITCTHEYI